MEVTTTKYKHCDMVKASGRVDSATAPQLGEALDALTNSGRYKIVLDLEEAQEFDRKLLEAPTDEVGAFR